MSLVIMLRGWVVSVASEARRKLSTAQMCVLASLLLASNSTIEQEAHLLAILRRIRKSLHTVRLPIILLPSTLPFGEWGSGAYA